MLAKVMKHEMKATWKVLFPLAMVLVGVTLIGMLMMKMQVFETDIGALVGLAMLLLYIIGLIALSVTAFIFLLVRFYHSMYGAEGYLSHTLPVTTFSLINGKLLVAVFWHAITTILVYVSAFSLIVTAGLNLGNEGERIKLGELLQQLGDMIGISIPALFGWAILYSVISAFSAMLMVYASMAIGQLFRHKVAMSIVMYGVLYAILQIISFVISINSANGFVEKQAAMGDDSFFTLAIANMYGNIFSRSMILSVGVSIVCYIITALITHKKLNLE